MVLREGPGRIPLTALMQDLAVREINEVLVEAGATICGELLSADLVDELLIYMAPHLLGSTARGMFNIPGLSGMNERAGLELTDVRSVGRDWRITARVLR